MYESLTSFIPKLEKLDFGEWILDCKGTEGVKQCPFVHYEDTVFQLIDEIYEFSTLHPEFDWTKYRAILDEKNIQLQSIQNIDVSGFDGKTIIALLVAVTRMERFSTGALLGFLKSGCIKRWLMRLKSLDDH